MRDWTAVWDNWERMRNAEVSKTGADEITKVQDKYLKLAEQLEHDHSNEMRKVKVVYHDR